MKNRSLLLAASSVLLLASSCNPQPAVNNHSDAVKATYIHKYGVEVDDQKDWQERGASGQVITKLKNGETLTETWQDGKRQGRATISFPHSDVLHFEMFYDNGARLWLTTNYASGMPRRQEMYQPEKQRLVSTWYEEGTPRSQETYKNNLLITGDYFSPRQDLESQIQQGTGERPVRDGYGQLIEKDLFSDGLFTLRTQFHPNGMPKSYTPCSQGKPHGLKKTFSPAGEPVTTEEWQEGTLNGTVTLFENAEKIAEIPYVDFQKNGIERRFRPGTSTVVEEITWNNSRRHGPTVLYIDQEKITDWYFDGKKVSRVDFMERQSS